MILLRSIPRSITTFRKRDKNQQLPRQPSSLVAASKVSRRRKSRQLSLC